MPTCSIETGVHHCDAITEAHRLLLIVGDQDRGDADVGQQTAHLVAQLHSQGGVEAGERLVEQHDAGLRREGAGQRHALLLAARQRAGHAVVLVLEADEAERLARPARSRAGPRAMP